jgi:hypothetical protein
MKITALKQNGYKYEYTPGSLTNIIIFGIEIATILIVLFLANWLTKTTIKELEERDNNYPSTTLSSQYQQNKYYFLVVLLGIIITHNFVIGGWHSPKDFIFIGILILIGLYVFRTTGTQWEQFTTTVANTANKENKPKSGKHKLQPLGEDDIDYNLPEPGRTNGSPEIVGSDLADAHPEQKENELIWGNRPEHYDFTPDDIPAYLELDSIRKLKRLQKKVKRDKNYKYLAKIKPYDVQSAHRPESGDTTLAGQGLLLHRAHGLDNILLENADKHKAYEMPKEVLDALANTTYGDIQGPNPKHWTTNIQSSVWKEGPEKFKYVKSIGRYKRNNGVPGSMYKFLKEPEPTLTPDLAGITCSSSATTTTRPDNLQTSPDFGTGPVIKIPEIRDEMIEANNKFRTAEYFTNSGKNQDTNQYSLYSDAINQRMPGSSDKISQYATNYPLVSKQSLERINDNCARLLDGSRLSY